MSRKIYIVVLLVISISLYTLERSYMFSSDIVGVKSASITVIVIIMIAITSFAILNSRFAAFKDKLSKKFTTLITIIYLISIIYTIVYPFSARFIYGFIILPLLVFYFTANCTQYAQNDNIVIWAFAIVAIMLSYYFVGNYYNNVLYETDKQNNGAYAVLYLLPFMLCLKNKNLRIISIIIILIVVLFSLKRGGLIALLMGVLVYFYVYKIHINKHKSNIFSSLVVICLIIGIYVLIKYFNDNVLEKSIFERMEEAVDTGGSGRLDIYKNYFEFFKESTLLQMIIGHGWLGSERSSNVGTTCHNDILEVLIDFGIIGLIVYVSFISSIIKMNYNMIKNAHEYAPAMGCSTAIFLINSMVSHIIIYPWYLMEFSLFWGFMVYSRRKSTYNKYYHNEKDNARLRNPS